MRPVNCDVETGRMRLGTAVAARPIATLEHIGGRAVRYRPNLVATTPPGIGVRPSAGAYLSVLEAGIIRTGHEVRLGQRSRDCDEVLGARSSPSSALW